MNFEYNSAAGFLLMVVGIAFIILAIWFAVKIAYATDSEDPAGWCLRHEYPYNLLCMQYERERLLMEINKNLEELNITIPGIPYP